MSLQRQFGSRGSLFLEFFMVFWSFIATGDFGMAMFNMRRFRRLRNCGVQLDK